MELIAQYIDDLRRGTVIPGGNLDTIPCIRCMAHAPAADIECYMVDRSTAVCVEDQITRTHLGRTDTSSCSRLGTRMMRQADAEVCHNRHRKSRTIRTIWSSWYRPIHTDSQGTESRSLRSAHAWRSRLKMLSGCQNHRYCYSCFQSLPCCSPPWSQAPGSPQPV